ncbi:MAG: thermonuclease family protein [Alphaproteobacteria bacterium]|nr:thermonuclease family protein [Alphaproteobacteria bacterium]
MHRLILILFLLGFAINSHAQTITYHDYHAEIIRIIDGDTFEANIAIFPKQIVTNRIRLRHIDAPELKGACHNEKQLANNAKTYLQKILPMGSAIRLNDVSYDSFGRVLATVSHQTYGDIGALLMQQNLAIPYQRGKKNHWCQNE